MDENRRDEPVDFLRQEREESNAMHATVASSRSFWLPLLKKNAGHGPAFFI
jgi:hypothetical protein